MSCKYAYLHCRKRPQAGRISCVLLPKAQVANTHLHTERSVSPVVSWANVYMPADSARRPSVSRLLWMEYELTVSNAVAMPRHSQVHDHLQCILGMHIGLQAAVHHSFGQQLAT